MSVSVVPLLSVLFAFIGIALLSGGLIMALRQRAWLRRAIKTDGVMVELLRQGVEGEYVRTRTGAETKPEAKYRYRPVVRFQTRAGQTITHTAAISERPAPYAVGDSVEVLYDPENPRAARLNRFFDLWLSAALLLFFGIFTLGMALLSFLLA